jgi:hypothetical protein
MRQESDGTKGTANRRAGAGRNTHSETVLNAFSHQGRGRFSRTQRR